MEVGDLQYFFNKHIKLKLSEFKVVLTRTRF